MILLLSLLSPFAGDAAASSSDLSLNLLSLSDFSIEFASFSLGGAGTTLVSSGPLRFLSFLLQLPGGAVWPSYFKNSELAISLSVLGCGIYDISETW